MNRHLDLHVPSSLSGSIQIWLGMSLTGEQPRLSANVTGACVRDSLGIRASLHVNIFKCTSISMGTQISVGAQVCVSV